MRVRKHEREYKRQLGQFMTPEPLAREIVSGIELKGCKRILEPSCGDGSFLSAISSRIIEDGCGANGRFELIGIEIDPVLAGRARAILGDKLTHNEQYFVGDVYQADFFHCYLTSAISDHCFNGFRYLRPGSFDLIVGNPPFGGTFEHSIEDALDRCLGRRMGRKIKKETYAFFIVACIDLLRDGGRLVMICSDTLLTIPTMTGLRHLLMESGSVCLRDINEFSTETSYPMVVLDFVKGGNCGSVTRNATRLERDAIQATANLSWGITPDISKLFLGPTLGEYFIASSGMTTGKNDYFVREIDIDGYIREPYQFEFQDVPITVEYELERARLGKISARRNAVLRAAELRRDTERRLRLRRRRTPEIVKLPDPRYRPYNKAAADLVYSRPSHYIYWEDDGDAVFTYKRTGNWYLRGVGGRPYFGREGLTWRLISSRFIPRYLPSGYILDSGSPCAFVRHGVNRSEIFFIIGWLLSDLANYILKTVINHTRNIQSKDFERMPYPWWVCESSRKNIIKIIMTMIADARRGRVWKWNDGPVREVSGMFDVSLSELRPMVKDRGWGLSGPSAEEDLFQWARRQTDNGME